MLLSLISLKQRNLMNPKKSVTDSKVFIRICVHCLLEKH